MSTVTVSMIVKDEEQYLADCLKSVQPIADEIIVVDTGSTDDTVEIALDHDAEVRTHEWHDHFADARNDSIDCARGDWVLWLDADERLTEASYDFIRGLGQPDKPVGYICTIKSAREDFKFYTTSINTRLFANHFGVQFKHRVHEQLDQEKLQGRLVNSPVEFLHLGYNSEAANARKRARNIPLMEQQLESDPNNPYVLMRMGHDVAQDGDSQQAVFYFRRALKADHGKDVYTENIWNALAHAHNDLHETKDAKRYAKKSLRKTPKQVVAWWQLYRAFYLDRHYPQALQALQEVAKVQQEHRRMASPIQDIEVPSETLQGAMEDCEARGLMLQDTKYKMSDRVYQRKGKTITKVTEEK